MPTISMFYGILVRMYMGKLEHNPPHIHVSYAEKKAIYDINDNILIKGELPNKQHKLIQAWIELHKEDLLANWEMAQNGETPFKIEPLR